MQRPAVVARDARFERSNALPRFPLVPPVTGMFCNERWWDGSVVDARAEGATECARVGDAYLAIVRNFDAGGIPLKLVLYPILKDTAAQTGSQEAQLEQDGADVGPLLHQARLNLL